MAFLFACYGVFYSKGCMENSSVCECGTNAVEYVVVNL